jgi:hypothetical protein
MRVECLRFMVEEYSTGGQDFMFRLSSLISHPSTLSHPLSPRPRILQLRPIAAVAQRPNSLVARTALRHRRAGPRLWSQPSSAIHSPPGHHAPLAGEPAPVAHHQRPHPLKPRRRFLVNKPRFPHVMPPLSRPARARVTHRSRLCTVNFQLRTLNSRPSTLNSPVSTLHRSSYPMLPFLRPGRGPPGVWTGVLATKHVPSAAWQQRSCFRPLAAVVRALAGERSAESKALTLGIDS